MPKSTSDTPAFVPPADTASAMKLIAAVAADPACAVAALRILCDRQDAEGFASTLRPKLERTLGNTRAFAAAMDRGREYGLSVA